MVTCRKADMNDIDDLVRLRIIFLKEALRSDTQDGDPDIALSLHSYFKATMADNSFISWLALDGNRIVGTSGLCFYQLPPSFKNPTGDNAYIMNMFTDPQYRGQGIAQMLFSKVVSEAEQRGYKRIVLHATEMGRPVYRKFGFKETDDEMTFEVK
jgi:GNAT superfamily N-acetyltransferase